MEVTKAECNFECERALRQIINELKDLCNKHYDLFFNSSVKEKTTLENMWAISQRFLILTRGALCVRPYPREPTDREERELRALFKKKKDHLHGLNNILTASLYSLKEKCGAFDRALRKVDPSLPSAIVEGGGNRQPIYYYIEVFADIFHFFSKLQDKMNLLGKFLMIEDIQSILEYMDLLKIDKTVKAYFKNCLTPNKQLLN